MERYLDSYSDINLLHPVQQWFPFWFHKKLYKPFYCKTYTTHSNNYNDSYPDLVIATFITFEEDFLLTNFHSLMAVTKELQKMPSLQSTE